MNAETIRLLNLLEQRISLLGSLSTALSAAKVDLVQLDIDSLERRIRDQELLCAQIQSLDADIDVVQIRCAARVRDNETNSVSDPSSARFTDVVGRLERTQKNVRDLNEQHRELLRRSRRTISALLNSFQTFATTYSNPAAGNCVSGERL